MTTKRKPEKKMVILKPSFRDIFVCKKNDHKPFVEIFIQEPENIAQQNLGTLIGIFEITDHSEDSSYIVNYLISVIKKEFFSRTNRGPIESFEAALHKANLALSKLASHGNINWIGNLNAICAIIEKNNLHIAQTGNATSLLIRNKTLTEITEKTDELPEENPLKTFQDVISGRMENEDKIILTTESIFEIFSKEEIKRSALKFSTSDFIQFLNTALINELDLAATLVIDIDEEDKEAIVESAPKPARINAFSGKSFQKEIQPQGKNNDSVENFQTEERNEIIEELEASKKDFVDKRTGHIYIKENNILPQADKSVSEAPPFLSEITEKSLDTLRNLGSAIGKISASIINGISDYFSSKIASIRAGIQKRKEQKVATEVKSASIKIYSEESPPETKMESKVSLSEIFKSKFAFVKRINYAIFFEKTKRLLTKILTSLSLFFESLKKLSFSLVSNGSRLFITLFVYLKKIWLNLKDEIFSQKKYRSIASSRQNEKRPNSNADISFFAPANRTAPEKVTTTPFDFWDFLKKLLPDFSKLKALSQKLDYQQRLYLLIFIILLFIIPYWISQWNSETEKEVIAPPIEEPAVKEILPLEQDNNLIRINDSAELISSGDIKKIINLRDKIFAITDKKIIDLEQKKEYELPTDFASPDEVVVMNDLTIIFFIKNKLITSFSPVSGKFQTTNIVFPENIKISGTGTYLTYLYVLDNASNQIYRYPRSETNGGFGDKTDWLRENINLTNTEDMAINDNIFLLDGNNILKFFKNKKNIFSLENTATPVIPKKIFTTDNSTNLYILDTENSRIIKTDNDGKIIQQYYNPELKKALGFAIKEETIEENGKKIEKNTAYFYTENAVKYFLLP